MGAVRVHGEENVDNPAFMAAGWPELSAGSTSAQTILVSRNTSSALPVAVKSPIERVVRTFRKGADSTKERVVAFAEGFGGTEEEGAIGQENGSPWRFTRWTVVGQPPVVAPFWHEPTPIDLAIHFDRRHEDGEVTFIENGTWRV